MAADLMDITNEVNREYDAFADMDIDAKVVSSDLIRLHHIPLNTDIYSGSIPLTQDLLYDVDEICCKGFGQKSGIEILKGSEFVAYQRPSKGIIPGSVVNTAIKPELLLLCSHVSNKQVKVVMMAIAIFCITEQGVPVVDIYGVAKNPKINYKNSFEKFLKELKNLGGEYSNVGVFALEVKKENTIQMTEQGRLRLYTSLGFSILPKTPIRMIYPPIQTYVVTHDNANPGHIVLYNERSSVSDYSVFIGNIQSVEDTYIPMMALKDDIGIKRDIYLGIESCFKGDDALLWNGVGGDVLTANANLKKNANVPIQPFEKGDSAFFFQSLYHMTYIKEDKEIPNNNYIRYFQVPQDFVIISFASPGSYFTSRSEALKNFTAKMANILKESDSMNKFIDLNRSTAILPIYNIQDNSILEATFQSNNTKKQLNSTVMNSIIVDSLGRQPIYEFTRPQASDFKKYQLDVQVYTEGMHMHNNLIGRQTKKNIFTGGRATENRSQAEIDDKYGIVGTYMLVENGVQLDDSPFVNKSYDETDTIEKYLKHLKNIVPLPQAANGKNAKYVIFLFGCSSIDTRETYETLYELSHRRSVVHKFPESIEMDNDEFINDIVHNKYTNPYEEKCKMPPRKGRGISTWLRANTRTRSRPKSKSVSKNKRGTAFTRWLKETLKRNTKLNRKIRVNFTKRLKK